jgi:hypothetical protein
VVVRTRLIVPLLLVTVAPATAQVEVPVRTTTLSVKDSATGDAHKRYFKTRAGTQPSLIEPGDGRIVLPAAGGAGDPTIHGATLIVYNSNGRPLQFTIPLPASGWDVIGTAANLKGYQYHDASPSDGPVGRIFVKKDKLFVMGGKDEFGYALDDTQQGRMAVRFTMGTEVTWCLDAPAKTVGGTTTLNDSRTRFIAPKTAAADVCPPLP